MNLYVLRLPVGVYMNVRMLVRLRERWLRVGGRKFVADPAHGAGEIQNAQQNQHQRDGKFQGQAEPRRNRKSKEDDGRSDHQNGDGVADSPEDADQPSAGNRLFPADDGGNRDHVIGIGGVAHPKKESDAKNEQDACH